MGNTAHQDDLRLRQALEASGQRFTEQRAAVHRFLGHTESHPNADEVFLAVRHEVPGISLATVYKSLETLVSCGLALKLTYGDGSARYDGRTEPHHHARCLACGRVLDIPGTLPEDAVFEVQKDVGAFHVTGVRLELTGFCDGCHDNSPTGQTPAQA